MKNILSFLILFTVLGFCSTGESIIDLFTEKNHSSSVRALAFSPKGDLVASSGGNTIIIRNAENGRFVREITGFEDGIMSLAFSADGKILAGGSGHYKKAPIFLWDVNSGKLKQTLSGHDGVVLVVAFSPDGKTLVSIAEDDENSGMWQDLMLWNLESGDMKLTKKSNGRTFVFSDDSKKLLFEENSGLDLPTTRIRLVWIDTKTGEKVTEDANLQDEFESQSGRLVKLRLSPDKKTLYGTFLRCCESDAVGVYSWNTRTGKILTEVFLTDHESDVTGATISPDGSIVATGSGMTRADANVYDSKVRLWDDQGKIIRVMDEKHTNAISNLVFSPDGSKLLSGSGHIGSTYGYGELIMWNVKTGKIEWSVGRK